jgi:hypothetical protein
MTSAEIEEFRQWHMARLVELMYPPAVVKDLSEARERWLAGVRRR